MIYYRRFGITVIPAKEGYVYRIVGNDLRYAIQTDAPLETQQKAADKAKEFIDEHLVSDASAHAAERFGRAAGRGG